MFIIYTEELHELRRTENKWILQLYNNFSISTLYFNIFKNLYKMSLIVKW